MIVFVVSWDVIMNTWSYESFPILNIIGAYTIIFLAHTPHADTKVPFITGMCSTCNPLSSNLLNNLQTTNIFCSTLYHCNYLFPANFNPYTRTSRQIVFIHKIHSKISSVRFPAHFNHRLTSYKNFNCLVFILGGRADELFLVYGHKLPASLSLFSFSVSHHSLDMFCSKMLYEATCGFKLPVLSHTHLGCIFSYVFLKKRLIYCSEMYKCLREFSIKTVPDTSLYETSDLI